uniref:Endo/exonuclease/phosphatase domain-containing protein n=1 Tax=Trichuris muris TaxID=70415 RepID=A0A5S6Q0S2_TRIMR
MPGKDYASYKSRFAATSDAWLPTTVTIIFEHSPGVCDEVIPFDTLYHKLAAKCSRRCGYSCSPNTFMVFLPIARRSETLLALRYAYLYADALPFPLLGRRESLRTHYAVSTRHHCPVPEKSLVELTMLKPMVFTLCSYNVLCQDTMERTMYLYHLCRETDIQWPQRWKALSREFVQLDADIFCLQEVQANQYNTFYRKLFDELGYKGAYKRKTKLKADGCAIFWRASKFELAAVREVEYFMPGTSLVCDNIGLVIRLRVLGKEPVQSSSDEEREIVVANTHLLFNERLGDVKLCQLALLLAHLQQVASAGSVGFRPVILCGDFNATAFSPLHWFLTKGKLFYEALPRHEVSGQGVLGGPRVGYPLLPDAAEISERSCRFHVDLSRAEPNTDSGPDEQRYIGHHLKFIPVYDCERPSEVDWVSFVIGFSTGWVDHIFYSSSMKTVSFYPHGPPSVVEKLRCKRRLELLSCGEILRRVGYLPNAQCGSDHLPLLAEFEFIS